MCLAVISLICSRASAQNLFAVDLNNGNIDEFTANGVRSTIAFGLNYPAGLAFDQAGNLFVADGSAIDKFTPAGVRTTFASGLSPRGLTFDSAGNLFVADAGSSAVYKFTPAGVRTTFASGLSLPHDLAFDRAGNLFVSAGDGVSNPGTVYKFTPAVQLVWLLTARIISLSQMGSAAVFLSLLRAECEPPLPPDSLQTPGVA